MTTQQIDVVFDGPPGPVSGHFIEVEDTETRRSISAGNWVQRDDGYWVLRFCVEVEREHKDGQVNDQ